MKYSIHIISVLLVVLLIGQGCTKDALTDGKNIVYTQSLKNIKIGEPVSLTFGNSNTKTIWVATPSLTATIYAVGTNATILFSASGTYKILAQSGTEYAEYSIEVVNANYQEVSNGFNVITNKFFGIKLGDTVTFIAVNPTATPSLTFTANGTNSYQIPSSNDTLKIVAKDAGFLEVNGFDGVKSIRRTVWVSSNVAPSTQDTIPFILYDKLILTPSIVNGKLVIATTTTQFYDCSTNNILSYNTNTDYMIDYAAVTLTKQTCTNAVVATCTNSFVMPSVGSTHTFTVNYLNKTFVGAVKDSANYMVFTWGDDSKIDISPKRILK